MFLLAAQNSIAFSLKHLMSRRQPTAKKKDRKQIKHVERKEQRIGHTFSSELIIVVA